MEKTWNLEKTHARRSDLRLTIERIRGISLGIKYKSEEIGSHYEIEPEDPEYKKTWYRDSYRKFAIYLLFWKVELYNGIDTRIYPTWAE